MSPTSYIRLRKNPRNVATPAGFIDLYADSDGNLIAESPGGSKSTVGSGGGVTSSQLFAIDIRNYGLTSGEDASASEQAANSVLLQTAFDEAGASGRPLWITGGPYKYDVEPEINYQGFQIFGNAFNWEDNNTSRLIQATAGQAAMKFAIPAGGFVNTHGIQISDLWLSGPGEGTSTAAGIDAYLDGPAGEVFSDFSVFDRLRIDGFKQGMRLAKFSNSSIRNTMFYGCTRAVEIGGNCNSVLFEACQFNEFPTGGHAFWCIGSGQIILSGTNEYGNGGNFIDFDTGVTGMSMEIHKLAVENQEVSSRVASNNSLQIRNIRFISGAYGTTVPFKYEAGSFGSIENDAMTWGTGNFRAESSGTVTLTIASPCVATKSAHGFVVGDRLVFTTTGALPTGITIGRSVFVTSVPTADTFTFSYTRGGSEINTSGSQSGTHTVTRPKLPLAYATLSSVIQRQHSQFTTTAPGTIEVYDDNNFSDFAFPYGFNDGKGMRDDGAIVLTEGFRGMLVRRFKRDSLGSTFPDSIKAVVRSWGEIVEKDIINDAALQVSTSGSASISMAVNTRYRGASASPQTYAMPSSAKTDDEIEVIADGAGGITISQPAGVSIRQGGSITTTGVSGSLTLVQGDVCRLKYYASGRWQVIGGNFNATVA